MRSAGRWQTLFHLFERNREWTAAQTALARDLLGTPMELRHDEPFRNPTATASHQVDILKSRLFQSLDALDEFERMATIAGTPTTLSRAMSNLRRYEAACQRNYQKALDQFRDRLQANPPSPSRRPNRRSRIKPDGTLVKPASSPRSRIRIGCRKCPFTLPRSGAFHHQS